MSVGESFTSNAPLASWRAGVQPKTEASNQHLSAWLSWGSGYNFLKTLKRGAMLLLKIENEILVMSMLLLLMVMVMIMMMMMAV